MEQTKGDWGQKSGIEGVEVKLMLLMLQNVLLKKRLIFPESKAAELGNA